MARLASAEKAGFYPLPNTITDRIQTHLAAPHGGRILDPCAGEGVALATLAEALALEPYGAELHRERAEAAAETVAALQDREALPLRDPHVRRLVSGDYKLLNVTPGGVNLLYLNPPYDHDHEAGRLEYQFLRDSRPWLQVGGVLVLVIPQSVLAFRKLARYLASWFEGLQVWRFPQPEYSAFRQVVLFGTRRERAHAPEPGAVTRLVELAAQGEALPALPWATAPSVTLPAPQIPSERYHFASRYVDHEDAIQEAAAVGVRTTERWRERLTPRGDLRLPVRPLMPLKVGHLAGLMAAGFLDHQLLDDPESGEQLLIKGRAYKRTRHAEALQQLPDGGLQRVTTATDQIVTDVTTVAPDGEVHSVTGAELESFMTRWLPQLTRHIATRYPPAYGFDYQSGPYAATLDRLSLKRKIPRLDGYGLMPAQKHAAAAVAARLERAPDAILVGQMGTGKTACATAVAACLGAGRTLVLCPPHLVKKWKREAEIVWPEVDVHILGSISDVDAFFALDTSRPRLAVLSHSKAKLASGWTHGVDAWQPSEERLLEAFPPPAGIPAETWGAETLQPRLRRYQQRRGVCCPACGERLTNRERLPLSLETIQKKRRTLMCPDCGEPLFQFDRRRSQKQSPGSFALYVRRERLIRESLRARRAVPGFQPPEGYARWPLATYIRRRYKGQLDLFIADEVHQFKGVSSDQGYAFHDLAVASRRVLGLTGTIFGGKASSLFHLLYRLSPGVCRAFTDMEATGKRRIRWKEWLERYGVLQEVETAKVDESGRLTANSRSAVRTKELPGASPAMLPWLLDRSVFLSLRDLGFALPGYEEIPVTVTMSPDQAAQYQSLYLKLKEELSERLVRGDKSLLGAYLQSLLCWVDAPWRDEVVFDPYTKGREDEGIEPQVITRIEGLPEGELFPKEEAILERILAEKAAGRRCVLYCQQTGTRDITGHWARLLEAHGLQSAVLKVEPDRREAWVAKQVKAGVDVIITHPRRVETGLDLLAFPTLIWMGTEYSVYTVMQASARSWRIGQEADVKVYFFVYGNTLQEQALGLIASKVAATIRVSGDVIDGDSLAELDDLTSSDMVTALARLVTDDESRAPSLADAFAAANEEIRQGQSFIGGFEIDQEVRQVGGGDARRETEVVPELPEIIESVARPLLPTPAGAMATTLNGHDRDTPAATLNGRGEGASPAPQEGDEGGLMDEELVETGPSTQHVPPATPPSPIPRPQIDLTVLEGRRPRRRRHRYGPSLRELLAREVEGDERTAIGAD